MLEKNDCGDFGAILARAKKFGKFREPATAGDRMDFTRGNLSPNLQARFCKPYPADFVG